MLKNYILVTLRNLRNNKLFSAINIAGLAIGLSACFTIWQYVRFESGYDKFHANAERLYRVPIIMERTGGVHVREIAAGYAGLGYAMKSEFPEVKDFCRVIETSLFTSDLGTYYANALEFSYQEPGGKLTAFNEEKVWFTDGPFLSMFSFPLIAGTADALKEPNSVVITRAMAQKYFGDTMPLGQEMRLNREMVLKVTGVIEDVPVNSHLQFDVLISFSTLRSRLGDLYENWGWSVFHTYVQLNDGADANALQDKLPAFKIKHVGPQDNEPVKQRFLLQPITDIHLRSHMEREQSPTGSERTVYFLTILAVFILVVAWINYINLSTAKALQRSKEVGLRKTVGATRMQLIIQFLFDTVLTNILALLLAAVLVLVSWSSFETLIGKEIRSVVFSGGVTQWLIAAAVFIAGVFISGAYPALALSSFSPALVLKGKFLKSSSGTTLRKLMISFQYTLAVLLIAGTVTIYLQLTYMRSMDTGFTKEQVIVVEAPAVYDSTAGRKIAFFKNEILQLSGVKNVTGTSDVPGQYVVEHSPVALITATSEDDYFGTDVPGIDTTFFSTFGIRLLEGRMFGDNERMNFRLLEKDELIPVIVNERFVEKLNLKKPGDAIGQKITFWWGPDQRFASIIGVVTNHHQVSFKESVTPMMYMQPAWNASKYFAVRLGGDFKPALASMQAAYASAFPGHPFSYFFLDQHFDAQYRDEQQFGQVFNVFTLLAIIVTCLGLLGLSVFSVMQRTKEVGVRKVLGASAPSLLLLFSKDFIRVLMISYAVSLPVIYWGGENWLENFTFRMPWRWEIFGVPLIIQLTITMLTIAAVSIRAAIEAPVRALRQE